MCQYDGKYNHLKGKNMKLMKYQKQTNLMHKYSLAMDRCPKCEDIVNYSDIYGYNGHLYSNIFCSRFGCEFKSEVTLKLCWTNDNINTYMYDSDEEVIDCFHTDTFSYMCSSKR